VFGETEIVVPVPIREPLQEPEYQFTGVVLEAVKVIAVVEQVVVALEISVTVIAPLSIVLPV
jgi:hypothetical protein